MKGLVLYTPSLSSMMIGIPRTSSVLSRERAIPNEESESSTTIVILGGGGEGGGRDGGGEAAITTTVGVDSTVKPAGRSAFAALALARYCTTPLRTASAAARVGETIVTSRRTEAAITARVTVLECTLAMLASLRVM